MIKLVGRDRWCIWFVKIKSNQNWNIHVQLDIDTVLVVMIMKIVGAILVGSLVDRIDVLGLWCVPIIMFLCMAVTNVDNMFAIMRMLVQVSMRDSFAKRMMLIGHSSTLNGAKRQ
ncbi:MAG: hypothetical protein Q7L19_00110 [Pseudohongiella sp.]|nr:hypothetical protein [Pseudohongiella sp.]